MTAARNIQDSLGTVEEILRQNKALSIIVAHATQHAQDSEPDTGTCSAVVEDSRKRQLQLSRDLLKKTH